jgi:hypothetical protein
LVPIGDVSRGRPGGRLGFNERGDDFPVGGDRGLRVTGAG